MNENEKTIDPMLSFISNRINLTDDLKFIHLDDTLRCLVYVLTHHLDYWITITKKRIESNSYYSQTSPDAGIMFNNMVSSAMDSDFTTEWFTAVISTFNIAVKRHPKISFAVKNIDDPLDIMFELCHYFFIPVRIDYTTIPRSSKEIFLRKWVGIVFVMPFVKSCCEKYSNVIHNTIFCNEVYFRLLNETNKIVAFTKIDMEWTDKVISKIYNPDNPTQVFARTFISMLLLCSIEIIKKFCPNYHQCVSINPNYDGVWINPFDPYHIEQINGITDKLQFVQV